MDGISLAQVRPIHYESLVRLGHQSDGGYVVPADAVDRSTVLVSLGLNDEWSFERAFLQRNPRARLLAFDGSVGRWFFTKRIGVSLREMVRSLAAGPVTRRLGVAYLRSSIDYFTLFRPPHKHVSRMVAPVPGPQTVSMDEVFRAAAATAPHTVFVKMDVEGAEYDLLPHLLPHAQLINTLVVEFHHTRTKAAEFAGTMQALRTHFCVVHAHGNNHCPVDRSTGIPEAVEITFLHRALVSDQESPSTWTYPRPELDFPCDPARPDVPLVFR